MKKPVADDDDDDDDDVCRCPAAESGAAPGVVIPTSFMCLMIALLLEYNHFTS